MTDTQTIVGEIPDPRPGYLACPHCGNDELSAREFLAINHEDPDRSIVSLSFRPDKSFIDVSAPLEAKRNAAEPTQ
jgi:hypothetical protein